MLDGLRKIGRTWFGKVLGAFLLVGLAGFGISNVILNFGSTTVAKVGDEEISIRDFQRAYNADLERVGQQIGRVPTSQEALAMNLPQGTLARLASEAAIDRLGRQMGIGVSDDRLGKMLREDPSFSGTLGQFNRGTFTRVLQQSGFTEAEYFNLQAKAARRQQIAAALFADTVVPAAAQELLERFTGDRRTIDYFIVNAQSIPPVAEPTAEELANYLSEHQNQFRTKETRTAEVLVLSLETLAATKTPTEEEIAAEYERTKADLVRIEKRTIRQVPLTAEQEAAFEAGKAAGKSFDDLVAELGLEVIELGTLARSEVTDPQLAEAAFSIQPGDFVLIAGIGGSKRAVAVSAVEPGGEVSLDEARPQIVERLSQAAARNEYTDILDQIEELRAAFRPLSEIAERFGLDLKEVTLTAGGSELAGVEGIPEGAEGRIATAIFDADQGDLAPTIQLSANSNVWFDIKHVEPARDQTLDEVRDQIVAALIEERTAAAIKAEVDKILARLEAGESFADVAASLNQFPTLSQPLSRSGDGTPVLNQTVANEAFNGPEGYFGAAQNGDGDHVVFRVVEVLPAETGSDTEARTYLDEATRQSLYTGFIAGLRDEAGIRVNQQALNQILALDVTGQ
ncbi:MAG TPA: hypothetical protein GYA10_05180 [Alphaproteobacteria bacterium]|nr:hypothetical protein [Alphaproteobacteria bacterium]